MHPQTITVTIPVDTPEGSARDMATNDSLTLSLVTFHNFLKKPMANNRSNAITADLARSIFHALWLVAGLAGL